MSKPSNIYIIRHAESISNAARNVHETVPDWKVPLTVKGREQAILAGEKLVQDINHNDIGVYVSSYRRTRETWEGISNGIKAWNQPTTISFVKEDPRLREQEYGQLMRAEEYNNIEPARVAYGPFYYRIPDGESGADVYDRCTGFLDTLYRDFEKPNFPDNVLIVTHGFTLRILLMRWFHWTPEEFHLLKNPHNCQQFHLRLNVGCSHYNLLTPFDKRDHSDCNKPHEV